MAMDIALIEEKVKVFLSTITARILGRRRKRFLSIDFGQAFVKILYIESLGGVFKLLNYALKKILPNKENRHNNIVEFISDFLKTNSILEKEVHLTINEPASVIIRNLSLPPIPKEEILKAAKWELKYEVSFDLEEALSDWRFVKDYAIEEPTKKNEIIFIAAESKTVDKYLSIISDCQLTPIRISSGPFNYTHLLKCTRSAQPSCCALLDIGYKDTTFCVYKNSKLVFVRTLAFSLDKLTRSLTTTLAQDEGELTLSYEKAQRLEEAFGIPQQDSQILEGNIQAMQILPLMRPLLEELAREIRRSFDYFTSNFQEEAPFALYITGGGANLKNLDKYLNKELNIGVSRLSFTDYIASQELTRKNLDKDQNQLTNALAAALADAEAINLLPEEIKTQKVELIEKVSLRLVAITVGAIFLFLLLVVKLQLNDYQNRLDNAQRHLLTLSEIRTLREKVKLRENLASRIQSGRVPVEGLLKTISIAVPNDAILEELLLEKGRGNLILKGAISADGDVAQSALTSFMEKIEASSFFTEASLVSSKKEGLTQRFEIKCDLAR